MPAAAQRVTATEISPAPQHTFRLATNPHPCRSWRRHSSHFLEMRFLPAVVRRTDTKPVIRSLAQQDHPVGSRWHRKLKRPRRAVEGFATDGVDGTRRRQIRAQRDRLRHVLMRVVAHDDERPPRPSVHRHPRVRQRPRRQRLPLVPRKGPGLLRHRPEAIQRRPALLQHRLVHIPRVEPGAGEQDILHQHARPQGVFLRVLVPVRLADELHLGEQPAVEAVALDEIVLPEDGRQRVVVRDVELGRLAQFRLPVLAGEEHVDDLTGRADIHE